MKQQTLNPKGMMLSLALTVMMALFMGIGTSAYVFGATDNAEGDVAFAQNATVNGVTVEVTADEGVFPEGATLEVKELTAKQAAKVDRAIDKIAGSDKIAGQYNFDITIFDKDGNEIQPDTSKGDVKVAFTAGEVADENLKAKVYHIKDDGEAEALEVAAKGDVAEVETSGFSAYALVFEHYDGTGSTGKYPMAYGQEVALKDILTAVGITGKTIQSAEVDSSAPLTVIGSGDETKVKMSDAIPSGTDHSLTVRFTDGDSAVVTIHMHKHNWELQADGNKATLKCTVADCPHTATYTATISASDATYDGQAHGAKVTSDMPGYDVGPMTIRYYSGNTQLSTTPVDAGTYRAETTISPDGGTAQNISTTYTIKKADINFTKEATPISNLIYNGEFQNLYTLAEVKSATTSKTDFPIKYWYTDATGTTPTINDVLTRKHADTYKISYQAVGDDNYNDSEVKTIEVTIGKRPVYFDGITAKNRIYNSKTNAELNYSQLNIHNVVNGESLTLTATGTFADKNVGTDKNVTLSDVKLAAGNDTTFVSDYQVDMNNASCQKTTKATITPKTIEFDWENAENFQYNGKPQAPTPVKRPGNAKNDDDKLVYEGDEVTAGVTDDSWKTDIGNDYEAKITNLTGKDAANYTLPDHDSHVRAKFNIVARVLEVEWANTEVEYNAEEQKPTATLKTPVEGEDVSVVITMDRTSKDAGTYTATASLSGEKAGNYTLNTLTETSTFVIKKAPLVIEASGWIYYGDRVSGNDSINELKFEIDQDQFKGTDTQESVLGGTPRFETDYGSKYNLVDPISDETHKYYLFPHFESAQNYEIDNKDGILTVYPKPVTLEWSDTHEREKTSAEDNAEYTYDGKQHVYSAVVSEDSYVKVNGRKIDDEITVTVQANVQRDANAKTETEKYTPYAANLSNKNYALVEIVEDGNRTEKDVNTRAINFTIKQLQAELNWTPAEFTYNGKDQRPEATVKNLQTDDNGIEDEAVYVSFDVEQNGESVEESKNVGNYVAKAKNEENGQLKDANYILNEEEPSFEYKINKAPLTVIAKPKTITYGEDPSNNGVAYVGFVEGEDESVLEGDVNYAYNYGKYGKPGDYTITPSGELSADNYEISFRTGLLKVNDKVTRLVAKGIAKGKKKGKISWNGVTGATSYTVYLGKCNKKSKMKKVATVKGKKYTTKKLKKNKFYKFYVVANTPNGKVYSSTGHFATGNKAGKKTNAKSLSVKKGSVSLSKGGKYTIGKSSKKAKKKLKWPGKAHGGNYRFMSDNTNVATVNGSGTITAVGSGWCRVYVQTTNGIWKTVQVYVR